MRIGIDIDGVLTDIEQYQIDLGTKYLYFKGGARIENLNAYYSKDLFGISEEDDDEFWRQIIFDYVTKEPARKFAGEVIQKLKDEGNEIYIITARGSDLSYTNIKRKEMHELVMKWLKDNSIYYDKILFTPEDKLEICLEHQIDIMIEDKPQNIFDISTQIPVICFHANYNRECEGKNITRCYSWYDIYSKIQKEIGKYHFE